MKLRWFKKKNNMKILKNARVRVERGQAVIIIPWSELPESIMDSYLFKEIYFKSMNESGEKNLELGPEELILFMKCFAIDHIEIVSKGSIIDYIEEVNDGS